MNWYFIDLYFILGGREVAAQDHKRSIASNKERTNQESPTNQLLYIVFD